MRKGTMTGYRRALAVGTSLLAFAAGAFSATLSPLAVRGYGILPEPQKVEIGANDVRFGPSWTLDRGEGVAAGDAALETLTQGLPPSANSAAATRVRLTIRSGSVQPSKTTDPDATAIAAQAYRITVSASLVAIEANASEGLFYGAESLLQLLRPRGEAFYLPEGRITDWPDLHLRHIYWDDAHHLDRLPELKRAVRQAASFKINGFAIKLEGHFQFRSAPEIVEPYAMTPAEFQELTDYGLRPRGRSAHRRR